MTARVIQSDSRGQPLTVAVRVQPDREVVCIRVPQAGNGGDAWEPVYQLVKDRAPLPRGYSITDEMLKAITNVSGEAQNEFAG
jgi:hypothetical protein